MTRKALAKFWQLLGTQPGAHLFNPWTDHDAGTDAHPGAAEARRARLALHLDTDVRLILVGEAAGYQGCHVTGIAFTSERLVLAGDIPRIAGGGERLSTRHIPWSEPSATTVWGTLHELGIAGRTVLWNACPWHPHRPGMLQSNRTPTRAERAAGLPVLAALLAGFPEARLLAVGRTAEASLRDAGHLAQPLRHPSMGGAALFRAQLRATLA